MALLRYNISGIVPDEESAYTMQESIHSIMFFRDLIRMTGLKERATDVGWSWGFSQEMHPYEEADDHAEKLRKILSIPCRSIGFSDLYTVWEEDSHRLIRVWGKRAGETIDLSGGGEDGVVMIDGRAEDLGRIAAALAMVRPKHYAEWLCRMEETPEHQAARAAGTAGERWMDAREGAELEAVRERSLCYYLQWGYMDRYELYDTFMKDLIKAWRLRLW